MGNVVEELRARDLLDVATDIAKELHITVLEMFAPGRHEPAPEGRGRFYGYLSALGWGTPRIAKLVGKHHTTVQEGLRQFGLRSGERRPA